MHQMSSLDRRYTWRPGIPNHFIPLLMAERFDEAELPQEVDLESEFPGVYDQQKIGSCVDNAGGSLIHRHMIITNYKWQFTPSRLFMYYNVRDMEGTTQSDSGSTIADWVAATNKFGVCPEQEADATKPDWLWTYEDDGQKFKQKPSDACYKDALLHKLLSSSQVNLDRQTVLKALAQKMPFVFGFTVHQSFESKEMASTGVMHVPGRFDLFDYVLGGHAVVAVGYKLGVEMGNQGIKDWVKVRNSWGSGWGQAGYFWMPLQEVLCNSQMASDAHTVDVVGF